MKHLLLTLLVLFSFSGCDDKEEQAKAQAKHKAQEARAVELAEFEAQKIALKKAEEAQKALEKEKEVLAYKAKEAQEALEAQLAKEEEAKKQKSPKSEDNSTLHKMGVEMGEGTFSIDTTKTKVFIDALKAKVDSKIKTIGDDLEKGIIQSKEAGIDINEKHIHIDLNKTQDILKDWGQKIQVFVNDFDTPTSKDTTTNKGN